MDRILSALLIFPYRCGACHKRSYTRSRRKAAAMTDSWERIRLQLLVFSFGLLSCMLLIYYFIQERMPGSE